MLRVFIRTLLLTGPIIAVRSFLNWRSRIGKMCLFQHPCCLKNQSRVLEGAADSPFATLEPVDLAEVGLGVITGSPGQFSPGGSLPGSLNSPSFNNSIPSSALLPLLAAAEVEAEDVRIGTRIEEMPQRSSSSNSSCSRPSSSSWSSSPGLRNFHHSQSPSEGVQECKAKFRF